MNRAVSWFCKIFIKPLVGILFIKEVKGKENIPKENFILASNHQSHLDIPICGYLCVPRRFTYIGQVDKYQGFQAFLRNLFYIFGGVIPVNREDETSRKNAQEEAVKSLKRGDILVIYPEGTRIKAGNMGEGKIGEGKLGVAKIFLRTAKPILPVGIKGTFNLLPPGRSFPQIKRIIEINIGKPLYFREELEKAKNLSCDSEDYKILLREIMEKVMAEIGELISQ